MNEHDRTSIPNDQPNQPPGRRKKAVGLRDVARVAGVSIATVSMVLNDNPRISRATHMKVQRVVARLGYRPHRVAQKLSRKFSKTVAVLLPPLRHAFADVYFGELISGITDRAEKLRHMVIFEQAKPDFVREHRHLEMFEQRYVDGMLCLGFNDHHRFLADFATGSYPVMMVDNQYTSAPLDYVASDYAAGARQVMNYLIQLGHREIGMITAAGDSRSARDIVDVYRERLGSVGVEPAENWIADGRFTEEGGDEAADRLLRESPNITAIFAGNDKMAIGARHCLARRNIDVPDQISLVGFDNVRHAAFLSPPLTTVHLPLYQVGALACERLVERIHGREHPVAERIATHLVVRESTALAPTRASDQTPHASAI